MIPYILHLWENCGQITFMCYLSTLHTDTIVSLPYTKHILRSSADSRWLPLRYSANIHHQYSNERNTTRQILPCSCRMLIIISFSPRNQEGVGAAISFAFTICRWTRQSVLLACTVNLRVSQSDLHWHLKMFERLYGAGGKYVVRGSSRPSEPPFLTYTSIYT